MNGTLIPKHMLIKNGIKAKILSFKNNTKIFSALIGRNQAAREIEGIPGDFSRLQLLSLRHSTYHHKGKRYENNQI